MKIKWSRKKSGKIPRAQSKIHEISYQFHQREYSMFFVILNDIGLNHHLKFVFYVFIRMSVANGRQPVKWWYDYLNKFRRMWMNLIQLCKKTWGHKSKIIDRVIQMNHFLHCILYAVHNYISRLSVQFHTWFTANLWNQRSHIDDTTVFYFCCCCCNIRVSVFVCIHSTRGSIIDCTKKPYILSESKICLVTRLWILYVEWNYLQFVTMIDIK